MKNKKHIIMAGNTAWGMFNFRSGVMRDLLDLGFHVTVLAPYDPVFSKKITALGCSFIHLPIKARGTNPLADLLLLFRFILTYLRLRPNIVFHYTIKPNIYGSIACRLLHIPCIAVTTGLGYTFIHRNRIAAIARLLYRFAFKKVRLICFLNEEDKRILVRTGIAPANKTKVLKGEGVDLSHYDPTLFSTSSNSRFCFTFIGRLIKEKGVCEFVEAAKIVKTSHPHVDFHLLGYLGVENPGSVSYEEVESWEKAGIIKYLGSAEDIRPYLMQASCIVLPSYREGIPRSLLEAAAMEKPIITTNNVGCKEVVEEGVNGLLCKCKSVESLRKVILDLLEMTEEQRKEMGKRGREKVKREFDEKLVLKEYISMIENHCIDIETNIHHITKPFSART